jgi:hypothetical protein
MSSTRLMGRLVRGNWRLAGAVAMVVAVGLVVVVPAHALAPSKFEIEGPGSDGTLKANLVVDQAGNTDWCADFPAPAFPARCAQTAPNFLSRQDLVRSGSDNSLGMGSDEDQDPPNFTSGSIPPQKSDLSRFYIASEAVGSPLTPFLYLGWQRSNTLGTANMDFEFNKGTPVNGLPPARQAGDVLITFDFSQGGTTVGLSLLRWLTAAHGDSASDCFKNSSLPCWGTREDLVGNGVAQGSVNDAVADFNVYDPIAGETILTRRFGEAAINLKAALNLGPNDCATFGSAYLKSRASDSFNSELKDFVAPVANPINFCQPQTIKLKKVDDRDGSTLGGAVLQLFRETNGTPGLQIGSGGDTQVGSDCTTSASDGVGNCTFTITVSGTYYGHEKTPPPGYSQVGSDVTQVVTIGAQTQTFTLTFSDHPLPGRIVVLKKDDANPANPLGGAVFRLYKDVNGNGTLEVGTDTQVGADCTTPSSGPDIGKCTFTGLDPGKYLIQEVSAPQGYEKATPDVVAVEVVVAAGGDTKTITFTDPRRHKIIVITCHQGTNTLVGSSVSLNGGTAKTSITTPPGGITAAQLCALGGAAFVGLDHGGGKTLGVTIPSSGTGSGH